MKALNFIVLFLFLCINVTGQIYAPEIQVKTIPNNYVGIGTDVPRSLLEISGSSPSSHLTINATEGNGEIRFVNPEGTKGYVWYGKNEDYMAFGRGSYSNSLFVNSTGNFGVGTVAPTGKFEIKGTHENGSQLNINTTSANAEIRFRDNGFTKGFVWYGKNQDYMAFGRGSYSNSLFVNGAGNFGIGTATPTGKFEIKGGHGNGSQLNINTTSSNAEIRFSDNGFTKGFVWYDKNQDFIGMGRGGAANSIFVKSNGFVGVGNTAPSHKLDVDGTVRAKTFSAELPPWADFVFQNNYPLKPLEEVDEFVRRNKHLPGIPSEKELKTTGLDLPSMNAKLLQKIEELTLYLIDQNKKINTLEKENQVLKSFEERLSNIENRK